MTDTAQTVIIGSGITGMLAARQLIRAGEEVTIVERGAMRLDADTVPLGDREVDLPSTRHNTEQLPRGGNDPWQYGYAFGGSSLFWAGVAPRILPADFEMRSRYGIWRDWPITYEDLVPFYKGAEQALEVAGASHEMFPGSDAYPRPPAEPSAVDRLLGPLLEPFGALPIARRTAADGYPPPIGSDGLAAIEPSVSVLGIARELASSPGFSVRDRTAAARLRVKDGIVRAIECIGAGGHSEIRADRVVLATHGIENAALLLRSGLNEPTVGRELGDHHHVELQLELDRPVEHWPAQTRDSGISYAWADGTWRQERASAVVIPFNPGLMVREMLTDALAAGERGETLRQRLAERFARTLVVYVSLEDEPREDRYVELSSRKDALGLPFSRVAYPADSEYVQRGLEQVRQGLEERLRPLGARVAGRRYGNRGGHMLGTCAMGPDGVVDENLRHHRIRNLYVAGGSAFPTHSPLHPTATIAALALRLGDHLVQAS